MKGFLKKIKPKKVAFGVLSFVMGLCFVAGSMLALVRGTVMNSGFLSETLNNSGYYSDLCDEIADSLVDIGDASGLDESFFDDFVDEVLVREDVQSYIDAFYAGEKLKVNTTKFSDSLEVALSQYMSANGLNPDAYDQKSLDYFIKEASKIYSNKIEVSYLGAIQKGMLGLSFKFNIIIAVLAVIVAGIAVVLFITTEWKHLAVRYIYYGTGAAGLFMLAVPAVVFVSGIIGRITIITRSLNDLYVSCITAVFKDMLIVALVLLVVSAALLVIHNKLRAQAAH